MKDKVIIITGAAMGLGYATAELLASKGARLVLVDYNSEALEKAAKEIGSEYKDVELLKVVADVSDEKATKNYVDETIKKFGRIDGFYNNAGIEGKQAELTQYDIGVFKKVIDINLMGVYYGMRYVIPEMKKQKYGRIVNASSVGGLRGVLNQGPYVASKHAVEGMTKNAAMEYGRYDILTNAISPGAILTPMVAEAFKQINPDNPKAAEKEFAQRNPTRRLGLPHEVASVVAYLLSEENSYINGQSIAIDGGESSIYGNP
ncbi:MAG: SDR family oxidoreductase [Bacteroidales bacterium]|nr:SDR family oxidoreductase [Bacteroidales bacterium]